MSTQLEAVAEAPVEEEQMSTTDVSPVVDRALIEQLVGGARAHGVAIDGEGGLLAQLTKLVVESALEGVNGHLELPVGGQQNCPLVATGAARLWPTDLPTGVWWHRPWSGAVVSSSG